MYITSVEIKNVKSISSLEIDFHQPVGWHVLIGDNGAGKTSIIRSIALACLGPDIAKSLSFEDFGNWLPPGENEASIRVKIERDNLFDKPAYTGKSEFTSEIKIRRVNNNGKVDVTGAVSQATALWGEYSLTGWFIAAYGPFRRLRGEASDIFGHIARSKPKLGACLTAFRDDAALTLLTQWLKDLALDAPRKPKEKEKLEGIVGFINSSGLLPNNAQLLDDIDSDGIKLKDGNGTAVSLFEMSDGYRSVLSMTIDIIRFLIETYGHEQVFTSAAQTEISLPGVVLIDEVDAHLHPTWQTRIGKWFTHYFPNIQFIVTTHSPLICRASEKGSIWRLSAPGSSEKSGRIKEADKNLLINGNVLDAFGTALFGENITISVEAVEKKEKLVALSKKKTAGGISPAEEIQLDMLQQLFPADDKIEL
jgi:hypothetical protein